MTNPAPTALGPLPSSGDFALVTPGRGFESVLLPAAHAAPAVLEYLRLWTQEGRVEEQGDGRWRVSVRVTDRSRRYELFAGPRRLEGGWLVYDFPRGVVEVPRGRSRWLRRALERVKPKTADPAGLPMPWVPLRHAPRVHLGPSGPHGLDGEQEQEQGEPEEVVSAADGEPLEALPPPVQDGAPCGVGDREIQELSERLRAAVGCPTYELVIERAREDQHGFTSGRVWFGEHFVPRRIALVVCPNADLAEVAATLLHELAHPLSRTRTHGPAFKETLVQLASATYGGSSFEAAREALPGRHALLDLWIATGVRAALRGDAPPRLRPADDGTAARVVSRIRKLRALAADQPGTPEAVAATAAANDLSTLYGFGNAEVRVEAGLDDQLVDRFLRVEKGKVWKRELAFAVCTFCDAFGLSFAREGRMHLFGRYVDLVFAEHLYAVCEAAIERKADAHVAAWKVARTARPTAAESRRERTSFCDTAVVGLEARMKELRQAEAAEARPARRTEAPAGDALQVAEEVARTEYEKRGLHWAGGSRKEIAFNEAGFQAGQSIHLNRAIDAAASAPLALPRGRKGA